MNVAQWGVLKFLDNGPRGHGGHTAIMFIAQCVARKPGRLG